MLISIEVYDVRVLLYWVNKQSGTCVGISTKDYENIKPEAAEFGIPRKDRSVKLQRDTSNKDLKFNMEQLLTLAVHFNRKWWVILAKN